MPLHDFDVITYNTSNQLKPYGSLKRGLEEAERDSTVWKIVFPGPGPLEKVQLIREMGNKWVYIPQPQELKEPPVQLRAWIPFILGVCGFVTLLVCKIMKAW